MNADPGNHAHNLSTMEFSSQAPRSADQQPTRVAFVLEQALGHVTHARNLQTAAQARPTIAPTWLPIPFHVQGATQFVPLLRSNWSVRASWRARQALDQALTRTAYDALVFHTQVTALFSVGHMRRIPTVVSMDATPINYDTLAAAYHHRPAGSGWVDRKKYRMNHDVFHSAAKIVAWSEWARQSLLDDYGVDGSRVRVLAPGAAEAYFAIGAQRHHDLPEHLPGSPAQRTQVLFVGGDFERKGGPSLLAAMRGPLADLCDLHVVTAGALPPQRNVHVYNGVGPNSPELLRLFRAADVFVLPSRGECLAVVLMEATAAGLPVITTDVGALGEAVRDGETGRVIPPADQGALEAALDALVRDPQLRQRMGRGGLALARAQFRADRNNEALLDLTQEVVEASRATRRAA